MPTKIAKLWVNHLSMTGDLSKHIAYLTNGHQLDPDEQQPQVWTKSLPKTCKDDNAALVAHWRGIYDRFLTERATPESMVHHNAKITGRQFVINLPNDISPDQMNQLAKAFLKDFPRHIPVSMVLHRTSNRGKEQPTQIPLDVLHAYTVGHQRPTPTKSSKVVKENSTFWKAELQSLGNQFLLATVPDPRLMTLQNAALYQQLKRFFGEEA